MCGVTGLWRWTNFGESIGLSVTRMADALRHRGPDNGGIWVDADAGLAFGHRRLAIVDLSAAGHQPMLSSDERYVLAYNGEIYNHAALRREIDDAGPSVKWRGHSDTETLLEGIRLWGLEAVLEKSVGMFAVALWDRRERTLRLARDRMGEKPLYYGWAGKDFAFASELKALRALPGFDNAVDRDALALFTQACAVPSPFSIYKDIRKLAPGTVLTLSFADVRRRHLPEPVAYWSVALAASAGLSQPVADEREGLGQLELLLKQAVADQMVADVPLGAFLSGGVDSSTVVALMQSQSNRPVQTFTVGFDEAGFDEAPYAAAVARHLGTEHHEVRMSPRDAQDVITRLPVIYDEPFADSSQIPTFLVSTVARRKVTVALSGDGGDELFGGYNRYFWGKRIWNWLRLMPLPIRNGIGSGILSIPPSAWQRLGQLTPFLSQPGDKAQKLGRHLQDVGNLDDLYRSLVTQWPRSSSLVRDGKAPQRLFDDGQLVRDIGEPEHRMMLWDMLTYLPDDILSKVDRAAMAVSLETRVPMLDHRVVEYSWRLPLGMKIRSGQGKWALRQVLYKYVPRELIERPKAGFAIPVGQWLRGPLRDWAESLLDERRLREEGYLHAALVREKWLEHLSGRQDWTSQLWIILMFQGWLTETSTTREAPRLAKVAGQA